jgi:hypothetical protein
VPVYLHNLKSVSHVEGNRVKIVTTGPQGGHHETTLSMEDAFSLFQDLGEVYYCMSDNAHNVWLGLQSQYSLRHREDCPRSAP